ARHVGKRRRADERPRSDGSPRPFQGLPPVGAARARGARRPSRGGWRRRRGDDVGPAAGLPDTAGRGPHSRPRALARSLAGRMCVSPFTFYRGAAMIMAQDLAATPRSGLTVQCCGDAHLSNFGAFASPERRLVFDINDFDETLLGPWEWDVKRLAASMLIAALDNGFEVKDQERVVSETAMEYRKAMRRFAEMNNLDVWYAHLEIESVLQQAAGQFKAKQIAQVEKQLA